jgi:hypothetical protein
MLSRELLLLEAGGWDQEQFGNPEKEEPPTLEAATKQWQWKRDCVH